MKKFSFAFTAILLLINSINAQNNTQGIIKVLYAFNHIRDTLNRDNVYKEHMVLTIGRQATSYKSYDAILLDSIKKANRKPMTQNANGAYVLNGSGGRPVSRTQIFSYQNPNKMLIVEKLFRTYIIAEDYPTIAWKISKDTLTVSGIRCQKAEGYFKGRNYIAWFAPDLPYNNGPWKLCGLPGLIIQAYDTKHEVEFLFDGLTPVEKSAPDLIAVPNGVEATRAEYSRLVTMAHDDPAAFFATTKSDNGLTFTPSNPEALKNIKVPVNNNPIELKP
jgi:GLPGLI family protein